MYLALSFFQSLEYLEVLSLVFFNKLDFIFYKKFLIFVD
jgi:hypothetical protein